VVTAFSDVRDTLGAAIRRAPHNTVDYEQQYSSNLADWTFTIMIVVGQVDDEAAQDQVGKLISPGSALIGAVNNAPFETGWARVMRGGVSQMNFGNALYTYAELSVRVTT
jgi:hypothetical protein